MDIRNFMKICNTVYNYNYNPNKLTIKKVNDNIPTSKFLYIDIVKDLDKYIYKSIYKIHNISIHYYHKKHTISRNQYADLIVMLNTARLVYKLFKSKCSIEIHYFDTKYFKYLPSVTSNEILGSKHINSGMTVFEKTRKIYIWRKTEHIKVLIHEILHACGNEANLWNLSDIIREELSNVLSCVESEFYMAEALNEVIASYLNYHMNIALFGDISYEYLDKEICITAQNCADILIYYGCTDVNDILNCKVLFRENTNVFSYFFMKLAILTSPDLMEIVYRYINSGKLNKKTAMSLVQLIVENILSKDKDNVWKYEISCKIEGRRKWYGKKRLFMSCCTL
jgi:hypothetical protein